MNEIYLTKLRDPRWQKKRLEVFSRDNWCCTKCGEGDKTLHVHHLKYIFGKEPWDYEDILLVTLCEECHSRTHRTESDIGGVEFTNAGISSTGFKKEINSIQELLFQDIITELKNRYKNEKPVEEEYLVKYENISALHKMRHALKEDTYRRELITEAAKFRARLKLIEKYGSNNFGKHLDELDFIAISIIEEELSDKRMEEELKRLFLITKARAFKKIKDGFFNEFQGFFSDDLIIMEKVMELTKAYRMIAKLNAQFDFSYL